MEYSYTENLESEIWALASALDDDEESTLAIDFLNDRHNFQPFGIRLALFISVKLSLKFTDSKTVIEALSKQCLKKGVPLSEIGSNNTLHNWFDKELRPKKSDASRQAMFALSFAIDLTIDETKALFHKIYLDRAFNYRNQREIIYYYCLKNRKTWNDAVRLINESNALSQDCHDKTQFTYAMRNSVESLSEEQELLEYIRSNGHNFECNSITAKTKFIYYLDETKHLAKDEISRAYDSDAYRGKWKDKLSNNVLYEIITGLSITGKKGTKTIFNNASLPKEIKNRFPEALTFGKRDMTSEEYRKAIILLFSYCFWFRVQWEQADFEFDDYFDMLNVVLFECGFSGLYYGNPFDWLFLFCTQSEQPLDLFREILAEVLD